MAAYYINVAEWTAENVAEWLGGLDDAIFPYAHFFINNQIDGRHLLTILPDDLKNLNITKIGHQEIILDAVDLLRQLHYTLTTETLQSIALRVGCKARSLYNDLKRNGPKDVPENCKQERISVSILSAVSDILIAVKSFISWLDRYPFEGEKRYIPIRKTTLKLSIELASTAQRDQFAENPHNVIKTSALNLAELCDRIIQEFNDSLIIQPATLDIVTVKRKPDEEWGLHIDSSYNGVLVVGNVKYQSPAHRSGKVEIGDEIIQVNYQTVVGWQLKKLVYSMCEHATDVHLTLKKRPRHANLLGQVLVTKPYGIPSRKAALARHQKWSDSNCSLHIQEGFPTNMHRAPIATEVDEEDDSAFLPNVSNNPVLGITPNSLLASNGGGGAPTPYQIFPAKSRVTVQRRATVSGASPTVARPPVNIEDLVSPVSQLTKELVSRSISHDPSKHLQRNIQEMHFLSTLKTIPADEIGEKNSLKKSPDFPNERSVSSPFSNGCSQNPQRHHQQSIITKTLPSDATLTNISSGLSASGSDCDSGIMDEKSWNPMKTALQTFEEEYTDLEKKCLTPEDQLRKIVGLIASPTTKPPSMTSLDRICSDRKHSSSSSLSNTSINEAYLKDKDISLVSLSLEDNKNQKPKGLDQRSPHHLPMQTQDKKAVKILQENSPLLRRKNFGKYASRRVSCKDLGQGDCQGWLHKRKDGRRLFSGPKWTKRYVVLKKQYLYCYHDKEDLRAECLVFLPGFAVSPASECKAKKYAFKLHSPTTLFLFASDSLSDMTKWMNKMGLAAISYPSLGLPKVPGDPQDVYYSETEDENEDSPIVGHRSIVNRSLSPSPIFASDSTSHSSSAFLASNKSVDSLSSDDNNSFMDASRSNRNPAMNPNHVSTSRSASSSSIHKSDSRGQPVTSPKQPNAAMKFTYPKPIGAASNLVSSPKKTVAEKPLEKSNPEPYRNVSKTVKTNRYSGSWNNSSPEHLKSNSSFENNSVTNPTNNCSRNVSTSPLSFCSYDSNNSSEMSSKSPQMLLRQRPVCPQRTNGSPVRPARPAVQQYHPNRAPFSPPGTAKTNVRFNQSASASTILRCSSLQKLNNDNQWEGSSIHVDGQEQRAMTGGQSQQTEFVSMLDREYRKLYGKKKPETISPKHECSDEGQTSPGSWWNGNNNNNNNNNMVRSATSRQIHSLYTRDSWKDDSHSHPPSSAGDDLHSRSISTSSDAAQSSSGPDSPFPVMSPEKGVGTKFYLAGVNSIGRMTGSKKDVVVSPPRFIDCNTGSRNLSISSTASQSSGRSESPSKPSKFSLSKQFSPKSPGNTTFRFFSSPKFVRKFTSPKLERKQPPPPSTVPSSTQTGPSPNQGFIADSRRYETEERIRPPPPPTGPKPQKSERTFLGSPKLARAFFGSPKQTRKLVNTATTGVQTEHTFDELVRLHQQSTKKVYQETGTGVGVNAAGGLPLEDTRTMEQNNLNCDSENVKMKRSGSNSSLNSSAFGSAQQSTGGSSLFYVETRIRPQITISLPLVTESLADDRPETPDTPRTPIKPTMGVSMLAKKRSPSASSDLTDKSRLTPVDGEDADEIEEVEEEWQRPQRSEIRVVVNGKEYLNSSEAVENAEVAATEEDYEVEALMNSLKALGLTPDGINLDERRKKMMLTPCQENTKLNRMILDLRALQRTLKDHQLEASAIEELFSIPVTSQTLQDWICRYNHLLPPDYC